MNIILARHRLTADKREIRNFRKFAFRKLLLSTKRYLQCRLIISSTTNGENHVTTNTRNSTDEIEDSEAIVPNLTSTFFFQNAEVRSVKILVCNNFYYYSS